MLELIAQLQQDNDRLYAELTQLQQENDRLHSSLLHLQAQYERSQASLSQVAELERAYAVLQEEGKREREKGERELKIAREQEKAAQERAAELAKANEALRGTTDRLANEPSLNAFLGHVISEACRQIDCDAGAIFLYDESSEQLTLTVGVGIEEYPYTEQILLPTAKYPGWSVIIQSRKPLFFHPDVNPEMYGEGTLEWHRAQGHHGILATAMMLGDRPLGQIAVAFRHKHNFKETDLELFQALAQQATLAVQLMHLAEEAKQAAIAREQEKAAQERAAELAKANEALRTAIAGLAELTDLDCFLTEMLKAAVSISEAYTGTVCLFDDLEHNYCYRFAAFLHAGEIVNPQSKEWQSLLQPNCFPPETSAYIERIRTSKSAWIVSPDAPEIVPEFRTYHQASGHRVIAHIPLKVEERLLGFLGLAFREELISTSRFSLLEVLADQMVMAIEFIRLAEEAKLAAIAREQEKAAQERAAELAKANEALRQSIDALTTQPSIEAFLSVTLRAIAEVLEVPSACLWKYEDEWAHLQLVYQDGLVILGEESDHPNARQPAPIRRDFVSRDSTGKLHTYPYFFYTDDPNWETRDFYTEMLQQLGIRCLLTAPIVIGDRAVGSITARLTHEVPDPSPARLELVNALANQAALALKMSQLAEEAKQAAIAREQEKAAQERAAKLAQANEVLRASAESLTSAEDLDSFLGHVLLAITKQLGARSSTVWLYDDEKEFAYLKFVVEDSLVIPAERSNHPNACTPYQVIPQSNSTIPDVGTAKAKPGLKQLDNIGDLTDEQQQYLRAQGTKALLAAPMILRNEDIGVFTVRLEDDRTLLEEDLELIQALANQATLAVQLTRLAEEAKQAAIAREQEKAAQERAAELAKANEALQESLSKLANEPELEKFLGHVLTVCAERLGAIGAGIWQMEEDEGYLIASYEDGKVNLPPESPHPGTIRAIAQQNYKNAAARLSKREMLAAYEEDFQSNPDYQPYLEYLQQRGIRAILSSPMFLGNSLRGSLTLRFDHRRVLKKEEAELALALANQAMLALELTRMAEEAKQAAIAREQEKAAQERVAELMKANEALQQSLNMLANEPSLDKVLGYVLKAIAQQFNARSAALWLHDWENMLSHLQFVYEEDNVIPAAQSNHPNAHRPSSLREKVVASQVLYEQKKPYLFNVTTEQGLTQEQRQYLLNNGTHYLLSVPMWLGHQCVGNFTLRLGEASAFDSTKLELAQALAHQATLALELTRLADEAKQEAEQTAILTERNRIAREIHDTLAQCLTGIIVQLQAAEDAQTTNPGDELIHILQATELAKAGLVEARRSVRALRPQALEDATTLDAALTQLAQRHSHNLSATCQVIGTPYFLPSHIEANLLRIAQEALTNCIRHAVASQVAIVLNYQPQQVTLHIQDDGCGFDTNQLTREGYGLMGMRERATEIGATLTLTSLPGAGTEVAIVLPLSPEG